MKNGFLAYHSFLESMELLNDAECGRLFRACLTYSKSGEVLELRGNERFVFPAMREVIDRDAEQYRARCEKNRDNAKARYDRMQSNANVCDRMRTPAKPANNNINLNVNPNPNPNPNLKSKSKSNVSSLRSETYCADAALNAAVVDFVAYRKSIKKPMTDRAVTLLLANLDKLSDTTAGKIAVLQQSIVNGWTGVFPLRDSRRDGGNVFLDLAREEGIV